MPYIQLEPLWGQIIVILRFQIIIFYNYFSATASSNGILGSNSSAWTITNNKFYQTATRTSTGTLISEILTFGNKYAINNVIGYANSSSSGTLYSGSILSYRGIEMTVGTGTSDVQNTISNINFFYNRKTTTAAGIFSGISVLEL
jgi:hypothetical protein